ncbi:glutamine amidotransferase [Corynebacterium uberis]|uniref:glutamine amidotransferase n=1 Tax=Corynebacterium TaxID=1716 RepID=UPI001D0A8C9F|nr:MULTISPECIES: glutamine amidotransferase [Corynebacterium]MCZ9308629.1 glutamine amidotransferase [Corynebacterium sp. c6VSa_13]UDL74271.1 glutamine amidotransferase [Corynebacterium uberis]UDL74849.1 glutamine amidotransferase [Corynebacterium uberis]UDL77063.1 glutamine amidotransferase [Corynebacterium uberis]UDL79346.1 glutamine amidotransferase [Corynebacterium uberis]
MSKFLLLSPRRGAAVAAAEYRDFLQASQLAPEQLEQRMFDTADAQVGSTAGVTGIFVGGSSLNMTAPARDEWHRRVVDKLSELPHQPLPCLFVCFGAGLIAESFGGAVGNTHPEKSGETIVELTADGAQDELFGRLPARFSALTGHTENVTRIPEGATLLASGPTCPVQAYRLGTHTWATQFHAEMDPLGMATRMGFYRNHGYFDDADFDDIVTELQAVDTTWSNAVLRGFVDMCDKRAGQLSA